MIGVLTFEPTMNGKVTNYKWVCLEMGQLPKLHPFNGQNAVFFPWDLGAIPFSKSNGTFSNHWFGKLDQVVSIKHENKMMWCDVINLGSPPRRDEIWDPSTTKWQVAFVAIKKGTQWNKNRRACNQEERSFEKKTSPAFFEWLKWWKIAVWRASIKDPNMLPCSECFLASSKSCCRCDLSRWAASM